MTEHTHTRHVGRPLPRFEDLRFVRGAGRYTDDVVLDGQAYAAMVRSPHAHARISRIDTGAARGMPGVLAVLTAADWRADGHGDIPQVPMPADAVDHRKPAFAPPEADTIHDTRQPVLAHDRVRHVGEPVAIVVAESALAARDAAEAVTVDYEPLPAVTDAVAALAPHAPQLHDTVPGNLALAADYGDRAAVEAALAGAHLVVEQTFINQRIVTAQMEPRAAIGTYDPARQIYTLISGNQGVHRQRQLLAGALNVAPERVIVICPDVGGAFGTRTNLYPEQALVVWASKRLGRPVKWTGDRSECFLTDFQGRDLATRARMGFDALGRIIAYALELTGNVGAHTVSFVPLNNGYRVSPSVYAVPALAVKICGVLTNTVPTAPFRGAGRPEALLVIERLLDIGARRLKIDRIVIRKRNLVARARLPYRSASALTYHSGDFAAIMARALEMADWAGFAARRREAKKRGRLRGIGVANYLETPVGAPHERVKVTVQPDDTVALHVGTQSSGQGHETSFAQVMADELGVTPEQVRVMSGDSTALASGGGTHSDRSMRFAGTLMAEAGTKVRTQAQRVAAALLGVPETEVTFDDGLLSARSPGGAERNPGPAFGTNRRLSIFDVARAIETDSSLPDDLRAPLSAETTVTNRIPAYPTGTAICELEVDPETGAIDICRYTSLDDAGQPINPLILHGQVHGGIAQGLGQALIEAAAWVSDTGQPITGSFMDYAMPRANLLPNFDVALTEDPTSGNPLRIKGGGEAGITPALAACMNALADALWESEVRHLEMPALGERARATRSALAMYNRSASTRAKVSAACDQPLGQRLSSQPKAK